MHVRGKVEIYAWCQIVNNPILMNLINKLDSFFVLNT